MRFKLNANLISRFTRGTESWQEIARRVSSLSWDDAAGIYQRMEEGAFVPAGQVLRGAGHNGAVLFNSYVIGSELGESVASVASRISSWTALGVGVGINVSSLVDDGRHKLIDVVTTIGRSQHRLWANGIRRTATMLVVDLGLEGIATVARQIGHDPTLRHLNMAVNIDDNAMFAFANNRTSAEADSIHALVSAAWECGNPGFVFIDRVNRDRVFDTWLDTCNACAEQFLEPDEGAPLASINLAAFAKPGDFDYVGIGQAVRQAVRFLDDVIDASAFPSERAAMFGRCRRRVGIGVMGLDTALRRVGVAYDSHEAIALSSELASHLNDAARAESAALALDRGGFLDLAQARVTEHRRNAGLLSIAPTGGISALWGVSSGIEPLFGAKLIKETTTIAMDIGSDALPLLPPDQISHEWHVRHVAAWQAEVDGGISKTVNLPFQIDIAEAGDVLVSAWLHDTKSVSIFRAGSRPSAVVSQ